MTDTNRARPLIYTGLGAVVFVALVIAGFGALSFATNTEVIAAGGLGPLPAVIGITAATIAFAATLLSRSLSRPGLGAAALAALLAAAVHLLAVTVAALFTLPGAAAAVASHVVLGGYSVLVFLAGIVAGALTVVGFRSGSGTPQWPWEKHDDDE
ncbi:hypothetical protein [Microbacterium sp. ZW T5_56]|uniref:hypothetical protein n=1 Tax=Microbacterium sp. ZW T5_56 TaxID=3378081 RepID=UPI0038540A74